MKKILITIIFGTLLMSSVSGVAFADNQAVNDACSGVAQVGDGANPCSSGSSNNLESIAQTIVSIMAKVVGVISVIMIIISGLRYILAGGDSNNINNARNTLIYAIVGLAIAALAQLIASEVLSTSSNIQTNANSTVYSTNLYRKVL